MKNNGWGEHGGRSLPLALRGVPLLIHGPILTSLDQGAVPPVLNIITVFTHDFGGAVVLAHRAHLLP